MGMREEEKRLEDPISKMVEGSGGILRYENDEVLEFFENTPKRYQNLIL